jgi:hypothetical protein
MKKLICLISVLIVFASAGFLAAFPPTPPGGGGSGSGDMVLNTAQVITASKTFGDGLLIATTPRFTTGIKDANGLLIIGLTATGTAVDYLTVTNAATAGHIVGIGVAGTDAAITLNITGKGTGKANIDGNAASATALAADPANCAAGQIALGVTAAGVAECTATPSGLTSVGATTFTGALTGTASGNAPASGIALTALAAQATDTITANADAGSASPTAIAIAAQQVAGRITGGHVKGLSTTELSTMLGLATDSFTADYPGVVCKAITTGNIVKCTNLTDVAYATVGQTMYIGSTQVAINRGTGALTLAGITLTTPDIGAATGTSLALTGNLTGLMPSVIVLVPSGTDASSSAAAFLTHADDSSATGAYIGMKLYNITDASSCTVTASTNTTTTCTLAGGTANHWDSTNAYQLGPGPTQSGSMFYVGGDGTFRWPSTVGYGACIMADGVQDLDVDMASDSMVFTGTLDSAVESTSAGHYLTASHSTTDDYICLQNKTAAIVKGMGKRGTWTKEAND